jgi:uncharacterized membrane protein
VQTAIAQLAAGASIALQAVAVLVILYGAAEAVLDIISAARGHSSITRRAISLHFARWLLLGLDFMLAARIAAATVSSTWGDVGQLAALAGVRTLLNILLERDIHDVRDMNYEAVSRPESMLPEHSAAHLARH